MKKAHLLLTISIIVISCKKDNVDPIPYSTSTPTKSETNSSIKTFFKQNTLNATQYFTINSSSGQAIQGSKGTYIFIPPNSFADEFGNTVNGNVDVELIEILSQADMVLLNKTTTSNGNLLVSGGELSIKAYQNNNRLKLAQGKGLYINMPTNNLSDSMLYFRGEEDNDGNLNWDTTGTNNSSVQDTIVNNSNYYDIYAANGDLGWINCDYFYGNPNLTKISINVPSPHDYSNTNIFLFFHNIYSVSGIYSNTGSVFNGYNFPIGSLVTIIGISEINGQLYSSFTPITLSDNHVENITFQPTTETDLENDINNL